MIPAKDTETLRTRLGGLVIDRDADLRREMRVYLDTLTIHGNNIGDIRRSLFVPWDSAWNGWVRDDTAEREISSAAADALSAPPQQVGQGEDNDLSRSPSPCPTCGTGSPRKP